MKINKIAGFFSGLSRKDKQEAKALQSGLEIHDSYTLFIKMHIHVNEREIPRLF